MRSFARHIVLTLLAVAMVIPVAGCGGSDPLTADNIRQRVADAMREAKTFHFTIKARASDGSRVEYHGDIRYDDQGNLKALEVTSKPLGTYRYVDGTMYHRSDDPGMFEKVSKDEQSQVLQAWGWAKAIESQPDPTKLTEKGEEEVGSVTATGYKTTTKKGETLTWWITDEDLPVRLNWGDGTQYRLTDYGEPVEFPPMGK